MVTNDSRTLFIRKGLVEKYSIIVSVRLTTIIDVWLTLLIREELDDKTLKRLVEFSLDRTNERG